MAEPRPGARCRPGVRRVRSARRAEAAGPCRSSACSWWCSGRCREGVAWCSPGEPPTRAWGTPRPVAVASLVALLVVLLLAPLVASLLASLVASEFDGAGLGDVLRPARQGLRRRVVGTPTTSLWRCLAWPVGRRSLRTPPRPRSPKGGVPRRERRRPRRCRSAPWDADRSGGLGAGEGHQRPPASARRRPRPTRNWAQLALSCSRSLRASESPTGPRGRRRKTPLPTVPGRRGNPRAPSGRGGLLISVSHNSLSGSTVVFPRADGARTGPRSPAPTVREQLHADVRERA